MLWGVSSASRSSSRIAVVPGEAFGAPGSLRLSYAVDDGELATGLERWRALATA